MSNDLENPTIRSAPNATDIPQFLIGVESTTITDKQELLQIPFHLVTGLVPIHTWNQLLTAHGQGMACLVIGNITAESNHAFTSDPCIQFAPLATLDPDSHSIEFDCKIINEDNHQIFINFQIDESYPARWEGGGSNIRGSFGGNQVRDPRWWGLSTSQRAHRAEPEERELNNRAIAAAALSTGSSASELMPVTVKLPAGRIAIHRTIRLDGLKCILRGDGNAMSATRIVAFDEGGVAPFNTSHFIVTKKFPMGSTPVVEIGYERSLTRNPDEGFQCGVQNLTIMCPLGEQARPVSGIMWESGLQERSQLTQVAITGYSGYGIGCPEFQTRSHNESDNSGVYPQVNSITIENFWITAPNSHPSHKTAIGIGLFGLQWTIRNGTVAHQRFGFDGTAEEPAIYVGTRETANISNIHIETSPAPNAAYSGASLVIEDGGNNGAFHIDCVFNFWRGSVAPGLKTRTIYIENPRAAVTCTAIRHRTNADLPEVSVIEDGDRAVRSSGNTQPGNSGYVALYSRQFNHNDGVDSSYDVVTTDRGLL